MARVSPCQGEGRGFESRFPLIVFLLLVPTSAIYKISQTTCFMENIVSQKILSTSFYRRHPAEVARDLLGKILVYESEDGICQGKIVETEAYHQSDPASHTYRGMTPRNAVMFGEPGHAYVYFTYGMHYCLNTAAAEAGTGAGVLLRAVEPLRGIEIMQARRRTTIPTNLCSGPGKLTQAFGITAAHNGISLFSPPLFILDAHQELRSEQIVAAPRVGITKATEKPWRFYIKDNKYISRK